MKRYNRLKISDSGIVQIKRDKVKIIMDIKRILASKISDSGIIRRITRWIVLDNSR